MIEVLAKIAPMPTLITSTRASGNVIIYANAEFLELSNSSSNEVLGKRLDAMVECPTGSRTWSQLSAALSGAMAEPEVRYRREDGSEFWAEVKVSPVLNEEGEVIQNFISFIDVSRQRQARQSADRLIDELSHRVKNTLTTVQSIVRQACRKSSSVDEVKTAIEGRIFALTRSHDLLNRMEWAHAGLNQIVGAAIEPLGRDGDIEARLQTQGDDIRVPPSMTLALGIALHELASNAVKHGALSNETGRVAIRWSLKRTGGETRLLLEWRERDGPTVAAPAVKGFGVQVLERGLALQFGGAAKLDFAPDGLRCSIDLPLPGAPDA